MDAVSEMTHAAMDAGSARLQHVRSWSFSTFVAKLTLTDPDKTAPPNSAPPLTSLAAWRFAYSALFTNVPAPRGTTAREVRHAPLWTDEHMEDPDTGSTRNGFLASGHRRLSVHVDSGRGAFANPAQ